MAGASTNGGDEAVDRPLTAEEAWRRHGVVLEGRGLEALGRALARGYMVTPPGVGFGVVHKLMNAWVRHCEARGLPQVIVRVLGKRARLWLYTGARRHLSPAGWDELERVLVGAALFTAKPVYTGPDGGGEITVRAEDGEPLAARLVGLAYEYAVPASDDRPPSRATYKGRARAPATTR